MKPDFERMNSEQKTDKVYSSDINMDMDKEFLYANYPYLRKENSPEYGVSDASELVFHTVDLDELCYMLDSSGTHMVLFGGVWSYATQSVMDHINALARKHHVDTIDLYDFSSEGHAESSIKRDLTEYPDYKGPQKKTPNDFAIYNYLYGEIASRFLTNLNDWVGEERKAGNSDDITYLNRWQEAVTVPNLAEPFLFIYNKNNPIDYSGGRKVGENYPIMWAAELSAYRDDEDGELYSDPQIHTAATKIDDFDSVLEEKIFRHVGPNKLMMTPYGNYEYFHDAFGLNVRGHSFKTQEVFEPGRQINMQKLNFQELYWLIHQKGAFMIMIAGPWCAYSQGASATVNDYAVANNLRVYMSDIRLDSKHAFDCWNYGRQNELTISCPALKKYYVDIWENFFEEPYVDPNSGNPAEPWTLPRKVEYTDESGITHSVYSHGVPYIQSFNMDYAKAHGKKAGTLAFEHGAFEIINTGNEFMYESSHYEEFKNSMREIFGAYCESIGVEMSDITIDRTAPLEEGFPVHHPENAKVTRGHNWNSERAYRDVQTDPGYASCSL